MSELRQRKGIIGMIQELDAFPKVEDDHRETSAASGGFSMLVFVIITILVLSEIRHFSNNNARYDYEIDPDFDKKLKLNVDMMVAMKCSQVGADIVDQTGEGAHTFGRLSEESVDFDLTIEQAQQFDHLRRLNDIHRSSFVSLQKQIWSNAAFTISLMDKEAKKRAESEADANGDDRQRHSFVSLIEVFPLIFEVPKAGDEKDACRFRGSLEVNKVAGNFHITAGKPLTFGAEHLHLNFADEKEYNFSHRIFQLGFGDNDFTLINPLDGEEKITDDKNHLFQYFLQVVPTDIKGTFTTLSTYQYSSTEQNRTISHAKGSHGLPGIFVKYDLSPLRVTVTHQTTTVTQLLVKLCAIVGGVFATTGIIRRLVSNGFHFACCQLGVASDDVPELPRHRRHAPSSLIDDPVEAPLLSLAQTTKEPTNVILSEKVPFRDL